MSALSASSRKESEKPRDVWALSTQEIERLKASRVVVSLSGGKDSTACALLLERHGISFDCVFFDTGWEHPVLYDYLENVLEPRFGAIKRLKSSKYPGGMKDMVTQKKGFPMRTMRFCTSFLKMQPFVDWMTSQAEDVINVIGIRRQESANRANAKKWDFDTEADCEVFRPLADHSFDDVITMHREGQIEPNPLYLKGASRVGCFPCIFARKSEIQNVAKLYPERIDQIEQLETKLTDAAKFRFENDEEWRTKQKHKIVRRVAYVAILQPAGIDWQTFKNYDSGKTAICEDLEQAYKENYRLISDREDLDDNYVFEKNRQLQRTFFHGRTDSRIRDVVEWAKTSRGGAQYRLFDITAQDGCTRWGMCDAALSDAELVKITGT